MRAGGPPDDLLVVDHQHEAAATRRARLGLRLRDRGLRPDGQVHDEPRAAPLLALHPDGAAVPLRDAVGGRQPEAAARAPPALVVKNGSKIRSRCSFGMPTPVSATVSTR